MVTPPAAAPSRHGEHAQASRTLRRFDRNNGTRTRPEQRLADRRVEGNVASVDVETLARHQRVFRLFTRVEIQHRQGRA
jgi:hypothetical protein